MLESAIPVVWFISGASADVMANLRAIRRRPASLVSSGAGE
jgi:hypothetical protein